MTNLPTPTEYQESVVFADWLRAKNISFAHIVNESGGKGSLVYGAKLKRMGRSKGFPDYLIFLPAKQHPTKLIIVMPQNLAVEMKRKRGGSTSDEQREWLWRLEDQGFQTKIAKGADEAITFVERFL